RDVAIVPRLGPTRVLIHQRGEELAIERAPVDADPHRLPVRRGDLDDPSEVIVVLLPGSDVSGIDPVLVEGARALGILREQEVAAEVEVPDDGRRDALIAHAPHDLGHRLGRLRRVDGDADELGSRLGERRGLVGGRFGIGGVRVGHRLDGDGGAASDRHRADGDRDGVPAGPIFGRRGGAWLHGYHEHPASLPRSQRAVKRTARCYARRVTTNPTMTPPAPPAPPAAPALPAPSVKRMFASIAGSYDRANQILSWGMHHGWRVAAVRWSGAKAGDRVLDCATGTGDLALAFRRAVGPEGEVVGTDFCEEMLAIASEKSRRAGLSVRYEPADVLSLPYRDASFDIASIAFGI